MLNVQTLGILLRALRDGNERPDALRAPGAVAGVARVTPVAADANESVRGDAPLRTLPALRPPLRDGADETSNDAAPRASTRSADGSDATRLASRQAFVPAAAAAPRDATKRAQMRGDDAIVQPPRAGARNTPAATAIARGPSPASAMPAAASALALSDTARWLTELLHRDAPRTAVRSRSAIAPLVNDAHPAPALLASALARAVQASGVFYESHLARWVNDGYPLASIASEPQAAWTSDASVQPAVATPAPLAQDGDKLAVVARQLDTLETRAFVWSGAPWPGQQATIEIAEDDRAPGGERSAVDAPAPGWRTRIAMTLPSLGRIEATLALRGASVELAIAAPSASHAALASARDALAAALGARSLELVAFALGTADGE